jgi:hypothetical protein
MWGAAEREAARCGCSDAAQEALFWTWANEELQQGHAANAANVLRRGLRAVQSPSLMLLAARVRCATALRYCAALCAVLSALYACPRVQLRACACRPDCT